MAGSRLSFRLGLAMSAPRLLWAMSGACLDATVWGKGRARSSVNRGVARLWAVATTAATFFTIQSSSRATPKPR